MVKIEILFFFLIIGKISHAFFMGEILPEMNNYC